jgi:predicted peptidase
MVILSALSPERALCQGTYAFEHLQVEGCGYQEADPNRDWTLNNEYLLYLPPAHDPEVQSVPVLFFLHGAGKRGDDLNKVASLAPPLQAENGRDFPFAIAAPQCLEGRNWTSSPAELMQFMEEVVDRFNGDRDRIYICGQSMGGAGTWRMLVDYPDYFAAAMPICGSGDVQKASSLVEIPIWVFHGRLDNVVPVARSIEMVEAIEAAGGTRAKLTIYEDVGHSSWYKAFKEPALYDWMLNQAKGEVSPDTWAGFERTPQGWVDTGSIIGWINVQLEPWAWSAPLNEWLYIPEAAVDAVGLWAYALR